MPICQVDTLCIAGSVFLLLPKRCMLLGGGPEQSEEPGGSAKELPTRVPLIAALVMTERRLMWRLRGGETCRPRPPLLGTSADKGERKAEATLSGPGPVLLRSKAALG